VINVRVIQKFYRAYVDRKNIYNSRKLEMQFLDMIPDDDDEFEEMQK